MGDSRNLSFSTKFNQPKIIANGFQDVSVPASPGASPDTLFTIATTAVATPLPPRIFVEYNGEMTEAAGDTGRASEVFGLNIQFIASFNSLNALVVRSRSLEVGSVDMRIYYRIYLDAEPS